MKGLCSFTGVATGKGNTARYVGEKYGFNYLAETADDVINDNNVNTVFITTRHNLHTEYVLKAIKAEKHIFVEKPLAMNLAELAEIQNAYKKSSNYHLMVGFNRRFAPAIVELKKVFSPEQRKSILIRVNSGVMPIGHWVNDMKIGGGRIIGEACHFIDLAMFLADSSIVSVSADALNDADELSNTVAINLKFQNGSIASINYFSNGNKAVPKENIEVFSGGTIARIDDFKSLEVFGKRYIKTKYKGQDKGHATTVKSFLESIKIGNPCPISFEELYNSTLATLKVIQSISGNKKVLL